MTAQNRTTNGAIPSERTIPTEVIEALRRMLDYQWDMERRDYEFWVDNSHCCDNHIFLSLQRVAEWLGDGPQG